MRTNRQSPAQWDGVAKLFHWSTAMLVLALFALGWLAVSYPLSPEKIRLFNWHKSIGLLVLAWSVLRLAWRVARPSPELPGSMSGAERRLARLSHGMLYALLIAMPVSGWIINSAADFPLKWFGLVRVPALVGPDERLQALAENTHLTLFWLLLAVLVLHVTAALHHHFTRGNDVLTRMLPFRSRSK